MSVAHFIILVGFLWLLRWSLIQLVKQAARPIVRKSKGMEP